MQSSRTCGMQHVSNQVHSVLNYMPCAVCQIPLDWNATSGNWYHVCSNVVLMISLPVSPVKRFTVPCSVTVFHVESVYDIITAK